TPTFASCRSTTSSRALSRPRSSACCGRVLRKFLAGIDLGDVARQLGDRVRDARTKPAPAIPATAVLARPLSRPTATQMGTKTFAARAEVEAIAPARAERTAKARASSEPS